MTAKKYETVFVHLLNDTSGSPKILNTVISAANEGKILAKLFVGSQGDGILSDVKISTVRYWYRRGPHRLLTLFSYLLSQAILFFKLLFDSSIDRKAIIYVNTLLPFGAAMYGWITSRKVVFHVHEISITPILLRKFLIKIATLTSSENIYVSQAHMEALPISGVACRCIHNALDISFLETAASVNYDPGINGTFNVLMIASLRDYKGIPEFFSLAQSFAERTRIRFTLLANEDQSAVNAYLAKVPCPENVTVYPRTKDTVPFYKKASVVVNLSRVDQCIETFGLTVLEAMSFGCPVIAPPVGGPAELLVDGRQGYLIDSRDHQKVREAILQLEQDPELCYRFSSEGRQRASEFSVSSFNKAILGVISDVRDCKTHI